MLIWVQWHLNRCFEKIKIAPDLGRGGDSDRNRCCYGLTSELI